MIVDTGRSLNVQAPASWYVIEPIRFERGLTRVQMVDDHLAELAREHRAASPDADVLLDARRTFQAEVPE